ncbi:alanine racemase [Paenibacillus sp. MBLB4367]|uniref:alanine racemase n=1 Tax=Paenibacillus sp. MBLB4367 TaxID=3384767 RepID=UPI00390820FF
MTEPLYSELDTPAVLVDLDVLDRNLRRTADLAKAAGVKLRPHVKTHKSTWIAREQMKYGACGITAAKLGEAEVMADAGITDILLAYPVIGRHKLERLRALLAKARVAVSVDSVEAARGLSELGESMGAPIRLYLDVNTGLNRCGREPGEATVELAKEIAALPGVRITGLMTHPGHVYGKTTTDDVRKVAKHEAESLVLTKKLLEKEGIVIDEVSVGSTPTSKFIGEQSEATEMRPGAYVFGDVSQLVTKSIGEEDCAMHVLVTVVSTPREGTIIVDGGSKTFSSDVNPHRPGYGTLRGNDSVYIERVSEEHGIVRVPEGVTFTVGDRLEFLINHCCGTTNLHQTLVGVRNGKAECEISVDARGKVK